MWFLLTRKEKFPKRCKCGRKLRDYVLETREAEKGYEFYRSIPAKKCSKGHLHVSTRAFIADVVLDRWLEGGLEGTQH